MTASRTTSASSSPKRCKASSRPACRKPTSSGRRRCSGPRTATAGAWASRSSPRSAICCPLCPRTKPISPCSTGRAAWRRTATGSRRGGNARRSKAGRNRPTLKRWLRRWTKVRHREAAERTLLTAIAAGLSPAALADALLAAETERAFADGGHSLDFINKAFECLDLIGWEHASSLLPTVVGQMAAARGAEESTEWRQPVDLVALCDEAAGQLPELFAASRRASGWSDHAALARELLGDDPAAIVDAIKAAVRARRRSGGPRPIARLRRGAAGGALRQRQRARRLGDGAPRLHLRQRAPPDARADRGRRRIDGDARGRRGRAAWRDGPLSHSLPQRAAGPHPGRGRRAARRPACRRGGDPRPPCSTRSTGSDRLISRQGSWRGISTLGHSPQALIATLAHAVLREDAGFHAYQMLEAGVRQFAVWGDTDEGRHILIAVARYLAAHSPTERAALQTADIARRLMRGGELHQSAEAS